MVPFLNDVIISVHLRIKNKKGEPHTDLLFPFSE